MCESIRTYGPADSIGRKRRRRSSRSGDIPGIDDFYVDYRGRNFDLTLGDATYGLSPLTDPFPGRAAAGREAISGNVDTRRLC